MTYFGRLVTDLLLLSISSQQVNLMGFWSLGVVHQCSCMDLSTIVYAVQTVDCMGRGGVLAQGWVCQGAVMCLSHA